MQKGQLAFTLAEVLITLAIIGVVASITIPSLMQNTQNQACVSALLKFNSNLQQAILLWKQDIGCNDDAYSCLAAQNLSDNVVSNFDQISKFLKIEKTTSSTTDRSWLPDYTYNYYGDIEDTNTFGRVSKTKYGSIGYLLTDGTTFSIDVDSAGFIITADVNGKKPPNRIGKDVFNFIIGCRKGKDIYYYNGASVNSNSTGLCAFFIHSCDPNNIDPTVGNGANPTAYVILNQKPIDFSELSKTVSGMKP